MLDSRRTKEGMKVASNEDYRTDESSDDERCTSELITTLSEDFRKCQQLIIHDIEQAQKCGRKPTAEDTAFNARSLVRAGFAYIEGTVSCLKYECLFAEENGGACPNPVEIAFIMGKEYYLDQDGAVKERPSKINLKTNIRFAFTLFEGLYGLSPIFKPDSPWWNSLCNSIKVRDRLTHPKKPDDLDVSPSEVIDMIKAVEGFEALLLEELAEAHRAPNIDSTA